MREASGSTADTSQQKPSAVREDARSARQAGLHTEAGTGRQRQPEGSEQGHALQLLTDAVVITPEYDVSGFAHEDLAVMAEQGAFLDDATGYFNYDCDIVLQTVYR